MNAMTTLRALGPIDLKSIGRDSFLLWMLALPIGVAALLRWGIPALSSWLEAQAGFVLEPYYPLILGWYFLMVPILIGTVLGFLLLDERDNHTLTALLVTPLSLESYLTYRIGIPLVLCTAVEFAMLPFLNLGPIPWLAIGPIAVLAALEAPIFALLVASIAQNKVQGFAVMKALGSVQFAPIVGWFIAPPWQYLAGIVPVYWPSKAVWEASAGRPSLAFVGIGLVLHVALLMGLMRRYQTIARR